MSEKIIKETCACGATFSATGTSYRSAAGGGTNGQHRGVEEMAERWRVEHRHIEPPETPTVEPGVIRPRIPYRGPRIRPPRPRTGSSVQEHDPDCLSLTNNDFRDVCDCTPGSNEQGPAQ